MSEEVHARADELDEMSVLDFVAVMHAEDRNAVDAITSQLESIARAVEAVADRLRSGGRLHYFGAGTSGLIAAMDAAECPATFGVAPDTVQAHAALEPGDEDDRALGDRTARGAGLRPGDAVVGVSASGATAYVLGALDAAPGEATRIAVTCSPGSPLGRMADVAIEVEAGPEVIAGSTRLKAGTVQKLVLNMLSTAVFTRLGRTHRGRMVDVVAANDKLRARAAVVVSALAGVPPDEAAQALAAASGSAKVAIVMLLRDEPADQAERRLEAAGGDLRAVLAEARRG